MFSLQRIMSHFDSGPPVFLNVDPEQNHPD